MKDLPKKKARRRAYSTANTMAAGSEWMPVAAAKLKLGGSELIDILCRLRLEGERWMVDLTFSFE